MSVFDCPDFDNHEQVTFFCDEASGLRAINAIHSTSAFGMSGGGCRIWPYASDDEALRDVLRLSKAMSYKLALAGMPAGGAKTVVIADPSKDKTEALLRALGRSVERLGGRYVIAEDVGSTPEDMEIIAKETKFVVGRQSDTSPATAYGVFVGLRSAVKRRLGRDDLEGLRVAVQGLGGVGGGLCRHLAKAGAKLWVTDIRPAAVDSIVDAHGATAVSGDEIYGLDVDVFAPCALGGILDDTTIGRLRCTVVAGGANNQLAEERHGEMLRERNILYAPDFVLNLGGVIGASQEGVQLGGDKSDYDESRAFKETERVASILEAVLDRAERDDIAPHAAAVSLAKEKMAALRG
jgi:leucine dehydrogenase